MSVHKRPVMLDSATSPPKELQGRPTESAASSDSARFVTAVSGDTTGSATGKAIDSTRMPLEGLQRPWERDWLDSWTVEELQMPCGWSDSWQGAGNQNVTAYAKATRCVTLALALKTRIKLHAPFQSHTVHPHNELHGDSQKLG